MKTGSLISVVADSLWRTLFALAVLAVPTGAIAQTSSPGWSSSPGPAAQSFAPPPAEMHCAQDEDVCLQRLPHLVRRLEDHLHLRLANGKTKTFSTTTAACDTGDYR